MLGNGFADVLAQPPQFFGLRFALTDHPVGQPALFGALLEQRQRLVGMQAVRILEFDQHVIGRLAVERAVQAFVQHMAQRQFREKLEGGQFQLAAEQVVNRHDSVQVRHAQHQHARLAQRAGQLQRRLHDEAQRAFAADE